MRMLLHCGQKYEQLIEM